MIGAADMRQTGHGGSVKVLRSTSPASARRRRDARRVHPRQVPHICVHILNCPFYTCCERDALSRRRLFSAAQHNRPAMTATATVLSPSLRSVQLPELPFEVQKRIIQHALLAPTGAPLPLDATTPYNIEWDQHAGQIGREARTRNAILRAQASREALKLMLVCKGWKVRFLIMPRYTVHMLIDEDSGRAMSIHVAAAQYGQSLRLQLRFGGRRKEVVVDPPKSPVDTWPLRANAGLIVSHHFDVHSRFMGAGDRFQRRSRIRPKCDAVGQLAPPQSTRRKRRDDHTDCAKYGEHTDEVPGAEHGNRLDQPGPLCVPEERASARSSLRVRYVGWAHLGLGTPRQH